MTYLKRNLLDLIWVRSTLNLRSEATVNRLSYTWWIIEPLLHMCAYYFVFSVLLNRGDENYVAFLLTGLIPWLWFSKSVNRAMNSIHKGTPLMDQLFIPKIFFPLTSLLQDAIKQVFVLVLLFIFVLLSNHGININIFWIIPVILSQLILITGVGLIIALVVPFFRDLTNIIPACLQFIMFCSGIFFSYKNIPNNMQAYFFINPMAVILRNYREVLVYNVAPNFALLAYVYMLGLILIVLALYFYKKLEYRLSRVVLE